METSRQRIDKAINHIQPDAVPINLMGFEDPGPWLKHFEVEDYYQLCDCLELDVFPDAPAIYKGPMLQPGLDIWGASYNWTGAEGSGYSGSRGGYPLSGARTVQDIEKYRWPRAEDFDFTPIDETLAKVSDDKPIWLRPLYIFPANDVDQNVSVRASRAEWIPVLCTLFNLFGMETALTCLALQPVLVEAAMAHIEEFILNFCEKALEQADSSDANIFWFGDDFAGLNGMLLSPDHWRRYLKPVYAKVFDLAKRRNMKVWFHSCGTFRPVMGDLIDIGMDIWETVQVHLPGNDPVELKHVYGKDITFYGGINSQQTLPFATPRQVREEVRERIRILGAGGGYICSSDHTILPDVPFENVLAMVDEAKKFSW